MLTDLFAHVCGQNPDHTWIFAGTPLPCCQRCTGLYTGILAALLLQVIFRPRLTSRFLEIHGAFLLLMVPFGFHWIPQGDGARTLTGFLFGLGLVAFLWLQPAGRFAVGQSSSSGANRSYWALAVGGLVLLLAAVAWGEFRAARVLAVVCALGLASLGVLALWNGGQLVFRLVGGACGAHRSDSGSGQNGGLTEAPVQIDPQPRGRRR